MYSIFRVKKRTGTYSDTLEAFGLANLLNEIQNRTQLSRSKLWIEDKGLFYQLSVNPGITEDIINEIDYFPLFKWAIGKEGERFEDIYFDYPLQKRLKKERQDKIFRITKEYSGKDNAERRRHKLKLIEEIYTNAKKIDEELDVYQQFLEGKPNIKQSFEKLYNNFKNFDRKSFPYLLTFILDYYSREQPFNPRIEAQSTFVHTITSGQILSPTDGLGLLKDKANGLCESKPNRYWICETMKISGALSNMHCKLVKITNNSWDLKVVVPDFFMAQYQTQRNIVRSFKRNVNVKDDSPIKTDILNLLILTQKLIENSDDYKGFKARNIVSGLFSVYQKDMGNNKSITNISKLQTPSFVEFDNEDEAKDWVEFLKEQINIIRSIEELRDATQGLIAYRTFLTSSHFPSWAKFIFWYAEHIMSSFSRNKYALPFKVTSLNKLFKDMNMNKLKISEIISNKGFQKVAYAIRKSTVTLQYTPKDQRKFEIRYGVAQALQNKSKSSKDLAEFIGEFIGTYNAETARFKEKHPEMDPETIRAIVKDSELTCFFNLIDEYPSKVVGALLASYGFALTENEE